VASSKAKADVAGRLLAVEVGARLPTTAELADAHGVGYGTVHAALRALQDEGVVTLSTHGHQGTRLVDRDLVALWQASGQGSLVGVLPLPRSLEFAGLATAAAVLAEKAGPPLHLTFRQGARERFALLRERRVDWVLSSGAAAASQADSCDLVLLPEHTYYSRDSVVTIAAAGREPDPSGRVAVDHRSHDHVALTAAEFPDAGHVDATYWWIPDMIIHGEVDAAVWHQTSSSSLLTATGLSVHPLRRPSPATGTELNQAALVFRRDDGATRAVLSTYFDPDALADLQHQVMTRRLAPVF
jgi:YhfZ C-terminal domain/Helix-turn-helix domain